MTIDAVYLLQLTLNGLALGLLYALIAVGLSLIFGVMEIINFAHGELLMLGAFAMCFALPVMGLLYWPAMAAAILGTMLVGFVIYELLLARLRPDEFERSILITLGLSIIIIHVMQYLFTATPRLVDTQYGFEGVLGVDQARCRREEVLHHVDDDDRETQRDQDRALELVGPEPRQ